MPGQGRLKAARAKILYARIKVHKAPGVWRTAHGAQLVPWPVTKSAKCTRVARSARKITIYRYFKRI
jgi:hypothetical protein